MTDLYLEAHVTIEPTFGAELDRASKIAANHGFKLAHLVMLKDKGPDQPSKRDTFMTAHGKEIDELAARTKALCVELQAGKFKVWRYKIESCVIDSRQQGDFWCVLAPNRPQLPLIACDSCSR